ncbi:MAG: hypothetical protein JWN48_2254 [Myxococcaceae bacterium]|nr:hypothetical protein [Myxococcaceae bacterium]
MRASALWLTTMIGCVGGANLGLERSERAGGSGDAGDPGDGAILGPARDDAGRALAVAILVSDSPDACGSCFQLLAQVMGDVALPSLAWEDGATSATRRVCPLDAPHPYTVVAHDPSTGQSATATVQLAGQSSCQDAGATGAQLCLQNGSFEAGLASLPALPSTFAAPPWLACGMVMATPNFPQVIERGALPMLSFPQPTAGESYLALATNEQVSQQPCASAPVGSRLSLMLDLAVTSSSVVVDASAPVLELWAGLALDCSQRTRLWTSPVLGPGFASYCATFEVQQPFDSLTLRASASGALPHPGRVLVDHVLPVAACP